MNSVLNSTAIKPEAEIITRDRLVEDLKNLGVQTGYLYNVKASLKSIGFVEGGAKTVIEAILEAISPDGTLVSDSFVDAFPLPLSEKHAKIISDRHTPSYAGAIANAMLKHPKAVCSTHPIQRFVAIGAQAEELMSQHTPESYAYDVLRVMAESGKGRNIKIGSDDKVVGVGTTHVAIGLMKFQQKRRRCGINYRDDKGRIITFERNWSGGCAVGFGNFNPLYEKRGAVIKTGSIGMAPGKLTDMGKTLQIELDVLSKDPTFFFCHDPACLDCRLSWEFSKGNYLSAKFHHSKNKLKLISHKLIRRRP